MSRRANTLLPARCTRPRPASPGYPRSAAPRRATPRVVCCGCHALTHSFIHNYRLLHTARYHIFCLQPPLQEVPSGKFIGPCCEKRRQGRKDVARKHSHSSTDSRHKKKRSKKSKKSKKASTPKARSKSQASFPTLQTYLSKTGETFRGIANLFCIDVDVLHQVNEYVS